MLPSDRWRTLATFLSVASTLESACSISAPNSSNILWRRNVFEHHWSGLIILDSDSTDGRATDNVHSLITLILGEHP